VNAASAKKSPKISSSKKPSLKATASKKASTTGPAAKGKDATAMLRADHKVVSALFEAYEKTRSDSKKMQIVAKLCVELTVHAQIEEEIFYPAVKQALRDTELVPEATVEHATLKDLIAQVEGVQPGGELFDAKIKVLSEYVKHHVKEEQNEIFPKAKSSRLDLVKLGTRMAERKAELLRVA
jgi:hemerythrin superfamily protein